MRIVMNRNRRVEKILNEKMPCTGCEHVHKCGLDLKACADFKKYYNTGRFEADTVRKPTRELYVKIFWDGRD